MPDQTVLFLIGILPAKGLHLDKILTHFQLRESKTAVLAGYVRNPVIVVEFHPSVHAFRDDAAHRFLQFSIIFAEAQQVARCPGSMPVTHKRLDVLKPAPILLEEFGQGDGNHVAQNDLLVRHVEARRMDSAGDDPALGILVVIEVVRIAAAVGQYQTRGVPPARAPGALRIVEFRSFDIRQRSLASLRVRVHPDSLILSLGRLREWLPQPIVSGTPPQRNRNAPCMTRSRPRRHTGDILGCSRFHYSYGKPGLPPPHFGQRRCQMSEPLAP